MPYTPPAQQSPAASRPESPPRSRDGLSLKQLPNSSPFLSGIRPNLPRSSSSTAYLQRHRRSPSSPTVSMSYSHSAELEHSRHHVEGHDWAKAHSSLRQSPPPVNNHAIPTCTIISPPDSGNNSSDEEGLTMAAQSQRLNNLAELQAAISFIEKERESRPGWADEEKLKAKAALGLDTPTADSPVTPHSPSNGRPPLSKEARKISHSKSATMTAIELPRSASYSPVEGSSDSDLDEEAAAAKPKMLRKKSGELVRPALRPASRRRPSSMPGTPTFSKAVHFSTDLEHVRHFLQVDRPLAVSAETSPVETFDDEHEYPFPENKGGSSASGKSNVAAFEWDIRLANFPAETPERKQMPVRVERVFLSSNKKTLIGTVAVQNLAFHKTVVARFTFDYWKTTSEVTAEFSQDERRQQQPQQQAAPADGLDRFNFNLQLSDQNNLENKTLFFCVRYVVNGQEFWDSNSMVNYQVDFIKKPVAVPASSKNTATVAKVVSPGNEATQHINGLPRSRSPRSPLRSPRRNFDDFGTGLDNFWKAGDALPRAQSAINLLSDESSTPLRFRSKASGNALEDLPGRRQAKGAAQALGNRYDFNKSLSAALTAASSALGERSGLPSQPQSAAVPAAAKPSVTLPLSGPLAPAAGVARLAKDDDKPPPSPQGLSYEELVEKYCFFGKGHGSGNGNVKSSPLQSGKPTDDEVKTEGVSPSSQSITPPAPSSDAQSQIETAQTTAKSATEPTGGRVSLSVSPARSARSSPAASPGSFGYPYYQPLNSGLVTPTAIRG